MTDSSEEKISTQSTLVINASYELFILGLLLVQLINSVLYVTTPSSDTRSVIQVVSGMISIFLIIDALYRLFKSKSKARWFFNYYGYLIFLGSLPLPFFALFRVLQSWLALRKLKLDDLESARQVIIEKRAQNSLLIIIIAVIIILEAASILVLKAEAGAAGANIMSVSDAIWWTIVTIATVGYGDRYPVTLQGRIVGVFVMIVGVSFFGIFTSYLAQWFLQKRQRKIFRRSAKPAGELSPADSLLSIKAILDQYETTNREAIDELRSRLAELEDRLTDKH